MSNSKSQNQDQNPKLLYEGSVKNISQGQDPKSLVFTFTDAYSVFDWGRMPDLLDNKGKSLVRMADFFFQTLGRASFWSALNPPDFIVSDQARQLWQELCQKGLRHHMRSSDLAAKQITVEQMQVHRPEFCRFDESIHCEGFWQYPALADLKEKRLLPLEVIFRFGLPPGSSFFDRLNEKYLHALGLKKQIFTNELFTDPIIEFFTKLEPIDRHLSYDQAHAYSCLSFEKFQQLILKTKFIAYGLKQIFLQSGIELWDGKIEWGYCAKEDELILVDSIGPDELRLIPTTNPDTMKAFSMLDLQLSKEFIRQYYRKTKWYSELKRTKELIPFSDFKKKVTDSIGEPPKLDASIHEVASSIYSTLAQIVCQYPHAKCNDEKLSDLIERMSQCLRHHPSN